MASIWIDANGTGHAEPTCDEFHGLPDMPVNGPEAARHGVAVCADCEVQA